LERLKPLYASMADSAAMPAAPVLPQRKRAWNIGGGRQGV